MIACAREHEGYTSRRAERLAFPREHLQAYAQSIRFDVLAYSYTPNIELCLYVCAHV